MNSLVGALVGDRRWMADAPCLNTDMYAQGKYAQRGLADQYCGHCDVRVDCLAHAIKYDEAHGVWGGFSESGRRRLRTILRRLTGEPRLTKIDIHTLKDLLVPYTQEIPEWERVKNRGRKPATPR